MSEYPIISLIIPCYNAEGTFEKCINSVLAQSYPKLEIIIVNDGSTDKTPKLIEKFSLLDSRIISVTQPNSGVSKARNVGIQRSSGSYICFVDADDWVDEDYCLVLYDAIIKHNADISVAEVDYIDSKNPHSLPRKKFNNEIELHNRQDALKLLLEDKVIKSYPWGKLYRSELLTTTAFPEHLEAFEDYYIMFSVFNKAQKVVKINRKIYNYIQFENSLSHNLTPKRAFHFFLAVYESYAFSQMQNFEPPVQNAIVRNILKKSFMILKRIIRRSKSSQMRNEIDLIHLRLSGFLKYSIFQIGVANYLFLRFFVFWPKQYAQFVKK